LNNEYSEEPEKPNQKNSKMFVKAVLEKFNIQWPWKRNGLIDRNLNHLVFGMVRETMRLWDLSDVEHRIAGHDDLRKLYELYKLSRPDNELSEEEKELKMVMKSVERVMYLRSLAPVDRAVNFNPAIYQIKIPLFPIYRNQIVSQPISNSNPIPSSIPIPSSTIVNSGTVPSPTQIQIPSSMLSNSNPKPVVNSNPIQLFLSSNVAPSASTSNVQPKNTEDTNSDVTKKQKL
jgi:hypothetical protein